MKRDVLAKGEWDETWGIGQDMARARRKTGFFLSRLLPHSAIPRLSRLLYTANAIPPFYVRDD